MVITASKCDKTYENNYPTEDGKCPKCGGVLAVLKNNGYTDIACRCGWGGRLS